MRIFSLSLLCCFFLVQAFSQSRNKTATFLFAQVTPTINDLTLGNNPLGMGLGIQSFFGTGGKFKPTVEITGDVYLLNDKVFRTNGNGVELLEVPAMVNLLAGAAFVAAKNMYVSLVAGPSFINGQTLFAIKPSFGFYFSSKQRWTGKISYINVFNRGTVIKENFSSVSFSLGVKLF